MSYQRIKDEAALAAKEIFEQAKTMSEQQMTEIIVEHFSYGRGTHGTLSLKGILDALQEIKETIPQYIPSYWHEAKAQIRKRIWELAELAEKRK